MSKEQDRMQRLKDKFQAKKSQRDASKNNKDRNYYETMQFKNKGGDVSPVRNKDDHSMFPDNWTAGSPFKNESVDGKSTIRYVPNKEGLKTTFPESRDETNSETDEETRKLIEGIN